MKKLLLIFLVGAFIACQPKENTTTNKITADTVDFIVLQLNDIYKISAVSGGKLGELARVQILLNELKAEIKNT